MSTPHSFALDDWKLWDMTKTDHSNLSIETSPTKVLTRHFVDMFMVFIERTSKTIKEIKEKAQQYSSLMVYAIDLAKIHYRLTLMTRRARARQRTGLSRQRLKQMAFTFVWLNQHYHSYNNQMARIIKMEDSFKMLHFS